MKLAKVEYEFFDFEDPSPTASDLARQIRLVFSDGRQLFVSWTSERQLDPDSEPYTIGYGEASFFLDEPATEVNASESPAWSKHLGHDVELSHVSALSPAFEYQVLEVRSVAGQTFVSSMGVDHIQVSSESPIPTSLGRGTSG